MVAWILRLLAETWIIWVAGLVGGVMLTALKAYWPQVAGPVLYGLAGFILIVGLLMVLKIGTTLDQYVKNQLPAVTLENVEARVRGWADTFGLGVQRVDELTDDAIFALKIITKSGRSIVVFQPKEQRRYLSFQTAVKPSPEENAIFKSLNAKDAEGLLEQVRLDIARAGHDYLIDEKTATFAILKRLPITGNLSEHDFISALDTVLLGQVVARDSLVIGLRRFPSLKK